MHIPNFQFSHAFKVDSSLFHYFAKKKRKKNVDCKNSFSFDHMFKKTYVLAEKLASIVQEIKLIKNMAPRWGHLSVQGCIPFSWFSPDPRKTKRDVPKSPGAKPNRCRYTEDFHLWERSQQEPFTENNRPSSFFRVARWESDPKQTTCMHNRIITILRYASISLPEWKNELTSRPTLQIGRVILSNNKLNHFA